MYIVDVYIAHMKIFHGHGGTPQLAGGFISWISSINGRLGVTPQETSPQRRSLKLGVANTEGDYHLGRLFHSTGL